MIDNTSGGDSAVLGLTRLSLGGFPLALVRQIPLSTPPLAIFIHKLLALRKTSNQENNEGSTSSLRNVNFCIDDANSHFLSPAYGGSGEGMQREATHYVCVCVCVRGHFVVSHLLDPGPSTWGLHWWCSLKGGESECCPSSLEWQWGHMVVCVSVYAHGSHHIPLCRVARCSMNRPTESRQITQTAADWLVALWPTAVRAPCCPFFVPPPPFSNQM